MDERNQILYKAIDSFIEKGELQRVIDILGKLYSADAAEIVAALDDGKQKILFENWEPEQSAETLLEMDEDEQVEIAERLKTSVISDILEEMPSDDAADLVGDLSLEARERIIKSMEPEEAEEVKQLLIHREDTAGGLMTPEYVALNKNMLAEESINRLRQAAPEKETIYYIFVINEEEQLVGVVSLRDLITADPKTKIRDIMNPEVIYSELETDQEEVARMMSKYDLMALPVVNHNHVMKGIITIDDVVDVIEDEATEDMYRMSGAGAIDEGDILGNRLTTVMKARMPWLMVALIGEVFIVGFIVNSYSKLITIVPALTIYWACMTSIGGNTSFQASTVAVRSLATGQLYPKDYFIRIFKEVRLGLMMGFVSALILFMFALIWQGTRTLAIVVAVANIAIVVSGAFTGSLAPIFFKKIGVDPAVSSAPFLALLMDAVSLLIYFYIAALIFNYYHIL